MAIQSTKINNVDTTVLTVPPGSQYAVTTIIVCSYVSSSSSTNDTAFDLHVLKGISDVKSDTNKILNNISIPAQESFTMSMERIVLEGDDRLVMVARDSNRLTTTISYLEV